MKHSFLLASLIVSSIALGCIITLTYQKWTKPAPLKPNPCEYLFTVTDDSLTVYDRTMDCERIVGTVKLEGQLDSLITLDNQ
jgi:hypothetical protein